MDARLDHTKFESLTRGGAHIIRNAGGRATDDAIRSLVISHKLVGAREWFVIHHTGCGISKEVIDELFDPFTEIDCFEEVPRRKADHGASPTEMPYLNGLKIPDHEKRVVAEILIIRTHRLVPARIPVYGYLYDAKSGALTEVPEATQAGASVDASECS
jgi:carbonic anhydrase